MSSQAGFASRNGSGPGGAERCPMTVSSTAGAFGGVIDLVHLARQTGGDRDLEHELLALFADQCVKHLNTIRHAAASDGCDAAHTLKGAARAVGAWAVADAAEKVEHALAKRKVAEGYGELAVAADEARAAISLIRTAA
jgi:HPt (histidine-containing phosphotransfer) domain-containing protein